MTDARHPTSSTGARPPPIPAEATSRATTGRARNREREYEWVGPAAAAGYQSHAPTSAGSRGATLARIQPYVEQARSSELTAVIEAIEDGIVLCSADGRVRLINAAATSLLGWDATPGRGIVERIRDGFIPQGRPFALDPDARPVRMWSRADPDCWLEVSTYGIAHTEAPDAPRDVLIVICDVSVATRREAIRDTFIGMLSHELKTPVTTIYGGAKVLARHEASIDDATRRAMFEDIVAEAERLQRLVDDIVAMTRFEDDREALGREPVLLQRLVPGIVSLEQGHWPDVRFETSIPRGLPPVMGDSVYVEQLVRNLLTNAAKYGREAGRVDIVLEEVGTEVVLRVLDEGPGIEPGHEELLFDLFHRSPRTSEFGPSAGIGLFVCARLVRAMGGRIWARRRPEGGAEFGVALRVMRDE